jgi:hypothetical protein
MAQAEQKTSESLTKLLGGLPLLAVYPYFAGWVYIYYYYDHFGISLNSLDIPVYHFFVYSQSPLKTWLGISLLCGIVLILLLISLSSRLWFLAFGLLLAFFPLFNVARERGDDRAREVRAGDATPITFVFKKDVTNLYPIDFRKLNEEGKLWLIGQSKDKFYVLRQSASHANELPYAIVFDINKTDVLLAKIDIQNVRIVRSEK